MPGAETDTYGAADLARNRAGLNKVITQWSDMPMVAGSAVTNPVRGYDLLCMLGRAGVQLPWGGVREVRKDCADRVCRRWSLPPLIPTAARRTDISPYRSTLTSSRGDVRHGKRGTIHQAYREGMEDQLGKSGLVGRRHRALDDEAHRRCRRPAPGRGQESGAVVTWAQDPPRIRADASAAVKVAGGPRPRTRAAGPARFRA